MEKEATKDFISVQVVNLPLPPLSCFLKNMFQNGGICRSKCNISAGHGQFGGFKGFFYGICGKAPWPTPAKIGDKIAGKSASVNIGTYANNRPGIKHGVNTTFAVVAHNKPAELQTCFGKTFGFVTP